MNLSSLGFRYECPKSSSLGHIYVCDMKMMDDWGRYLFTEIIRNEMDFGFPSLFFGRDDWSPTSRTFKFTLVLLGQSSQHHLGESISGGGEEARESKLKDVDKFACSADKHSVGLYPCGYMWRADGTDNGINEYNERARKKSTCQSIPKSIQRIGTSSRFRAHTVKMRRQGKGSGVRQKDLEQTVVRLMHYLYIQIEHFHTRNGIRCRSSFARLYKRQL